MPVRVAKIEFPANAAKSFNGALMAFPWPWGARDLPEPRRQAGSAPQERRGRNRNKIVPVFMLGWPRSIGTKEKPPKQGAKTGHAHTSKSSPE